MEKVMERLVDSFLYYTADVPADEVGAHVVFSTVCDCKPDFSFDAETGWHTIIHKSLEK